MTRAEAAKVVAMLLAAFPNALSNTGTTQVYERMLADLDYSTASAAVERLIATARFLPTIAEIRDACIDLSHGDRRAGGEAWGECLKAIGRFGVYRSPGKDFSFQDPLVARCVAALGWENLCNSENQMADRARFIELYDQLAVGVRKNANVSELPAGKRLRELQDGHAKAAESVVLQLAEKLGGKS